MAALKAKVKANQFNGVGGAIALVVIAILQSQGIEVSAELAAAITAVCAFLAGFLQRL